MKEVKRDDWFSSLESEYLEGLKATKIALEEAEVAYNEAKEDLKEAVEQLMRLHERYPPDYDGPAPLF